MIYLHPEFVVRCNHPDCEKTLILDRRSAREEREGKNTWDLIAEYLLLSGWSFSRSQGYVVSKTCPEHKTPWIPVPTRGQYDGDERFYRVVPRERWASAARGENHLRRHDRPEPQQVYDTHGLQSLGEWSGGYGDDGEFIDTAKDHSTKCFCSACCAALAYPF